MSGDNSPQRELDKMRDQDYALAGWTKGGIPKAEKLRQFWLHDRR
jgi:hypothetical protein